MPPAALAREASGAQGEERPLPSLAEAWVATDTSRGRGFAATRLQAAPTP